LKSFYSDAIDLAKEKLGCLVPENVCRLCGAGFDREKNAYMIDWMTKKYELSLNSKNDYSAALEILFMHYLTSEGTKKPEGKLISYREVPGAAFYEPKFIQRAVNPIVRCFGKNPGDLIKTGEFFGGEKSAEVSGSAYSVKINLFSHLPVTYVIWAGDEEMEAAGNILFDKTAPGWLCAEDLAVAASLGAYELIGEYKKSCQLSVSSCQ